MCMSGFISELVGDNVALSDFRVMWCGNTIWVTNYIKLLTYTDEHVVLKIKGNLLNITGVGMKVICLEPRELTIRGKINSVSLEKPFSGESTK